MSSFNRVQRRRIDEILVDQGLVTKDHVEEALRIQKKTNETLGSILVDMGCITDMDITKTIVMQYQLPFISLTNCKVSEKLIELFDVTFLHSHKILPFDQIGDMLLCAVAEVPREEVLAEIPKLTQRNVALYVAGLTDVVQHLEQLAPLPEELQGEMASRAASNQAAASEEAPKKAPAKKKSADKTQIFQEESSEAILQALDSTWDSIFDSVEGVEGEESEEGDGESQSTNVLEDLG